MKRDTPSYIVGIARDLRKSQTNAEKILWNRLRGSELNGYKFRRQYPIGRYIADFYCCKARLVVEVDGGIHSFMDVKEYDLIRQDEIEARKITVIRFSNEDITNNIESVLSKIQSNLAPLRSLGEGVG